MLNEHFLCIFKLHTLSMTEKTLSLFFPSLLPDFGSLKAHNLITSHSELRFLVAISHYC